MFGHSAKRQISTRPRLGKGTVERICQHDTNPTIRRLGAWGERRGGSPRPLYSTGPGFSDSRISTTWKLQTHDLHALMIDWRMILSFLEKKAQTRWWNENRCHAGKKKREKKIIIILYMNIREKVNIFHWPKLMHWSGMSGSFPTSERICGCYLCSQESLLSVNW